MWKKKRTLNFTIVKIFSKISEMNFGVMALDVKKNLRKGNSLVYKTKH
jgi:hypothetical protein